MSGKKSVFTAKMDFPADTQELLESMNLESGGLVQQVVDNAVISYDMQYVPWKTGTLGRGAYTATVVGSGKVVYPGPYARYQYYGMVMGPNIPIFDDDSGEPSGWWSPPGKEKHLTGARLTYDTSVNALAGSYWFERMKADHAKDIVEEAKAYVGRKR